MQQAFGLYTHIRANAFRSLLLIGGLFGLIYALAFGYCLVLTAVFDPGPFNDIIYEAARSVRIMAPYITAGAMVWIVAGYFLNRAIIGAMTGARTVTRKDEPELYNLLENLCMSRGMVMPRLSVIEIPELNAFASGLSKDQYTITVTTGLMACLEDDEIEAVLAHELTHIRNQDVRLMVIAVIIVGMIAMAIEIMFRWAFYTSGSRSSGGGRGNGALPAILLGIAIIFGVWFLSQLMNFALSRRREYMADAGAVELTKNPDAMISALRKIQGCSDIEGLPSGLMEMCIDNPRSDFTSWFATHPSIEDRVAALKTFAGGEERSQARAPRHRRIAERAKGIADNPWDGESANKGNVSQAGRPPTRPGPNPWSMEEMVLIGGVLDEAQRQEKASWTRKPAIPSPWRDGSATKPADPGSRTEAPDAAPAARGFAGQQPAPRQMTVNRPAPPQRRPGETSVKRSLQPARETAPPSHPAPPAAQIAQANAADGTGQPTPASKPRPPLNRARPEGGSSGFGTRNAGQFGRRTPGAKRNA